MIIIRAIFAVLTIVFGFVIYPYYVDHIITPLSAIALEQGEAVTETLRPNAAGDETNITSATPAVLHWQNIDDVVPDDSSSFVNCDSAAWERDLYNLPVHSLGTGRISKVTVYTYCGTGIAFPGKLKCSIKTDGSTFDSPEQDVTSLTFNTYSADWLANPATGTSWTWAEIDALQAGVSLYNAVWTVYCTQVYIEIESTELNVLEQAYINLLPLGVLLMILYFSVMQLLGKAGIGRKEE